MRIPGRVVIPAEPAVPRDAASVLLLRGGERGLEVHLQQRHSRMPFAPEVLAFPGGGVDARDLEVVERMTGPTPAEWAAALEVDETTALAVVVAAVRELFEETGVLLAGEDGGTGSGLVGDTSGTEWEAERLRVAGKQTSLAGILNPRGLALRGELLHVWSQWTTPEFEPRRFRTWFLVAELPEGQNARDVSGETDSVGWWTPRDAIADADSGARVMFPPQYCMCLQLFDVPTPAQARRAPGPLERVQPRLGTDADGHYVVLPPELIELGLAIGERMRGLS